MFWTVAYGERNNIRVFKTIVVYIVKLYTCKTTNPGLYIQIGNCLKMSESYCYAIYKYYCSSFLYEKIFKIYSTEYATGYENT